MMAELQDIVAYILREYPHPDELSNARVTKMVYLADWLQAITNGRQMSNINWFFDNFGPFVWDVKEAVEGNPFLFDANDTRNMYGNQKTVFSLKDGNYSPHLAPDEKAVLDRIIEITKGLYWKDFIRLVYSTHPIMSSARYSTLDLVAKAREYKQQKSQEQQ
ncbi:MAG: Panacea domain-containing protein [Phycisphaerae bacterium]